MSKSVLLILLATLIFSCSEKNGDGIGDNIYDGPTARATKVRTNYTEIGFSKIKLKALTQLEFANKDKEFPDSLYLQFFKVTHGEIPTADLRSDFAHYYADKEHWHLTGNVIYTDLLENKVLKTEELYWSPRKELLWSEVFVHITTPGRELMGDGLEAKDDFSWYKIKKPRGRKMNGRP
ncbi:MAG: LPS export ABC transporter periplasmic protein LptC [Cyclobacteriaceae bacterium]